MGDAGRLAVAVGVVAAGSAISLATYFGVGGPFGAINDVGNAATGVLSAALAWRLRRRIARPSVAAALAGAALTVIGSALVISETTGYFLAGLVSSTGFAGIGLWLVILNRSKPHPTGRPSRLRSLGLLAGALMTLGIITAPGILLQLDDMATAPTWIWPGQLAWLGTYLAYPAWAIWFGTAETRQARAPMPTQPGKDHQSGPR